MKKTKVRRIRRRKQTRRRKLRGGNGIWDNKTGTLYEIHNTTHKRGASITFNKVDGYFTLPWKDVVAFLNTVNFGNRNQINIALKEKGAKFTKNNITYMPYDESVNFQIIKKNLGGWFSPEDMTTSDMVFTEIDPNKNYYCALKKEEIEGFRWHM